VLVHSWKIENVIQVMLKAHPYDEPAYDIYVLKNKNLNFGYGAIGELKNEMKVDEFLSHVSKTLKTKSLKFTNGKSSKIKNIAVCGGSCDDLVKSAIAAKADAFITADIKYHTFQDAEDKILLVDAGHYETEIPIINLVKKRIEKFIITKNGSVKVFKFSGSTNPVKIYNN